MRTAEICPTCATYENALCVVYDGAYLTNLDVSALDDLPTILQKINDNLVPKFGTTAPSVNAVYIGQLYVNTAAPALYYAKAVGTGAADWQLLTNT